MTQDERWFLRYNEVRGFIEKNHRNPSKYYDEEKLMVHFLETESETDECWGVVRAKAGEV